MGACRRITVESASLRERNERCKQFHFSVRSPRARLYIITLSSRYPFYTELGSSDTISARSNRASRRDSTTARRSVFSVKRAPRIRAIQSAQIYGFQFRDSFRAYSMGRKSYRPPLSEGNKARYILHAYRKCGDARLDERARRGKAGATHMEGFERENTHLVRMAGRVGQEG